MVTREEMRKMPHGQRQYWLKLREGQRKDAEKKAQQTLGNYAPKIEDRQKSALKGETKMVDTTNLTQSNYIGVETITDSPSKKALILGEGKVEDVEFEGKKSQRLTLPVNLDGRELQWSPNKESISNFQATYGPDSAKWVGKDVAFKIEKRGQFMSVIGRPAAGAAAPKEETVQ